MPLKGEIKFIEINKITLKWKVLAITIKQWTKILMATQIPPVDKINLTLNNITSQEMLIINKNQPTNKYKTKEHLKIEVIDIKIVVETIVPVYLE